MTSLRLVIVFVRCGWNRRGRPGDRRSHWFLWGAALIVLATGGYFGWRAYRLSAAGAAPHRWRNREPGNEGRGRRRHQQIGRRSRFFRHGVEQRGGRRRRGAGFEGLIIAAHQIQLSPQVGGEIIWLDPNFKEGAVYKKGDKLAEVDPVIYAAQLDSARPL